MPGQSRSARNWLIMQSMYDALPAPGALLFSDPVNLFEQVGEDPFVEALKGFSHNGDPTRVEDRGGVPFLINEFWTARQRQGHALQEISYRACFKPQLPEFFIERLTEPGDTVYDPFMGRGTTPVQAVLMGRAALGNDINPLSAMLTRPRTRVPALEAIRARLDSLSWEGDDAGHEDLRVFYHPETLAGILALRSYLLARAADGTLDPVDEWVRMVALNRLTGHSSGFFSVYSLPPNQAVSLDAQRKINAKRSQTPPYRNVKDIILKKTRTLLKDGPGPALAKATFLVGPAERTAIPDASVALVVTSPPFLDIVQYAADNWLRCWFAGIEADGVPLSMHRKAEDWQDFVRAVFKDLARVVKPGGHVCFEVGEVRNGKVLLEDLVLAAVSGLPFRAVCVVVNAQAFTKTANCWGIDNNAKGTNTNRIVVLQRV